VSLREGWGSLVGYGLAAQAGDSMIDEAVVELSRRCSARELSQFKAAGEDRETSQNKEAVAREKSGGCCEEMEVRYRGDGGGRQQAAASNGCWLRDVSRKKKRRGKKRSRPAGRKNGPHVELDWATH
jgi:hypothetical protein